MRTLPLPDRSEARDQLERALELYTRKGEVHGYAASPDELDDVVALYDSYDAGGGLPSVGLKGEALAPGLLAGIHDGYGFTHGSSKLSSLRASVLGGVELCPICGIAPPREVDHYLPKSVYPPLAIYIRNLVPLCHDCNHSKGAYDTGIAAAQFLHPYFDLLPDVQFVRAIVGLEGGALTADYDIDPAAPMPEPLRARLTFQFGRLKLNERFQPEINTYLISHSTGLGYLYQSGSSGGVQWYLNKQAATERTAFHRNHWRPVLLAALALHEGFCAGGFQNLFSHPEVTEL